MSLPAGAPAPVGAGQRMQALWRLAATAVLGFASGLPLALTGQAMQAWLTTSGLDLAAIGFLSLVGIPYTFKFLWAPLMDRFDLPLLGRRRGWLVLTQALLALLLLVIAQVSPTSALRAFALLALAIAFVSASQDIVVDAYRTDLLSAAERGMGASLVVMGYRLAMILSGGVAFIWTDVAQGAGWTWPEVYRFMAVVMGLATLVSAFLLPPLPAAPLARAGSSPLPSARRDLLGFVAVVVAVAVGGLVTEHLGPPVARALVQPLLAHSTMPAALQQRWVDLTTLLLGIALTLPLAAWAARRARFETLLSGLSSFFSQPGAIAFLVFAVLFKLGDAFAASLMTPFLLKAMAFSSAEVGVVNKVFGLWLTIGGALIGGLLMLRLGLWRALMLFGALQLLSNLGFWWLAVNGKGMLAGIEVPAFDWGFVKLASPTPVDGGLLAVVVFENLSGGMGTAAFGAFMMALCNRRFTATQFALLSAFSSVGRVWVGPLAGVLAESIGWPSFFLISTVLALPGLLLLGWLRAPVQVLDQAPDAPAGEPAARAA